MTRLETLRERLAQGGFTPKEDRGELTIVVPAAEYRAACLKLRDELGFEEMIDL